MFRWLLAIFIAVAVIEIWGLIALGGWIGAWKTIALILLTGVLGAYLARREFTRVWAEANRQFASGRIPGHSMIDGLCVFAGGILLLTPGLFTDLLGFLLLVPPTRRIARNWVIRLMRRRLDQGMIRTHFRRW